jgi:hypothetical protein
MSSREGHPAVQRRGAALTAAARVDPHAIGRFLDDVPETDFFFGQKPGKPYSMGWVFLAIRYRDALILHWFPPN